MRMVDHNNRKTEMVNRGTEIMARKRENKRKEIVDKGSVIKEVKNQTITITMEEVMVERKGNGRKMLEICQFLEMMVRLTTMTSISQSKYFHLFTQTASPIFKSNKKPLTLQ